MNDQQKLAAATQQYMHAMPMVPLKPADIQKMNMHPVQPALFPHGLATPAPFLKTKSGRDIPFVAPAEDFAHPMPTSTFVPPVLSSKVDLVESLAGKKKRHSQLRPSNNLDTAPFPQKYEVPGPVEVSPLHPGPINLTSLVENCRIGKRIAQLHFDKAHQE
jgi:hypothetical protein